MTVGDIRNFVTIVGVVDNISVTVRDDDGDYFDIYDFDATTKDSDDLSMTEKDIKNFY